MKKSTLWYIFYLAAFAVSVAIMFNAERLSANDPTSYSVPAFVVALCSALGAAIVRSNMKL